MTTKARSTGWIMINVWPLFALSFCYLSSSSVLPLSFSHTCVSNSEDDALPKLKQSFNTFIYLFSWNPNSSAWSAKWEGAFCTNNMVVGLHLSNLALSGNIIDVNALLHLPGLRSIGFVNNSFSSPIPQFKLKRYKQNCKNGDTDHVLSSSPSSPA